MLSPVALTLTLVLDVATNPNHSPNVCPSLNLQRVQKSILRKQLSSHLRGCVRACSGCPVCFGVLLVEDVDGLLNLLE